MPPWFVWKVLFPLQEKIKGHPTLDILRRMEQADRMTPAQLEQWQAQLLGGLIQYSHAHVPFVRSAFARAGLEPRDIQSAGDLRKLPVTTKNDMRAGRQAMRSEIATGLQPRATGGSTGAPLIFDLSTRRIGSQVACRQRVSRWWGLAVGDPELALWGSPIEVGRHDWIRRLRDRAMNTELLSAFEMNEATMSRYLDVLEHRPCRQIFAYPSAIELLCRQARKEKRDLRKLGVQVVFVTGEVLYPHQRTIIEETLACQVADGYGGRDSGFIAHECPSGRMHVMADAVIVELLDPAGNPAPPGEPGEIVVTDLYSHEAPFIRYATGDVAVASGHRCPCGRPLPVLERIEGRQNDLIAARDGRFINSLALIYPVREVDGIEQFRVVQEEIDRFHVQILKTPQFPAGAEERIRTAWARLLRSEVNVVFEYVGAFPAERSGKFRHVLSKVAGPPIPGPLEKRC